MTHATKKKIYAALDALNANDTRSYAAKAEYLEQFTTRDDVLEFARIGNRVNPDEASESELEEEAEWVDDAWSAVREYMTHVPSV